MANLGQRQVVDLMVEVGLHLIEPYFLQTLAAPIGPGSPSTIILNPASPLPATSYLYPGALIVVDWHQSNAEVVSVIAVIDDDTFTANLLNAHAAGEQVFSATFPTQQPTDPIFTQSEIIGYIAQAQNEFLTKVPLIFDFLSDQLLIIGQSYQTLATNQAIELERVAIQSNPASMSFNIASIARLGGTVTAVLASSANPDQWTPGLAIQVYAVTDNSYNSVNNSTFSLTTVSSDGLTLTWLQAGPDSASSGGYLSRPILTRLYESSQEQIALNQPWQSGLPGVTAPTAWWEDRAGVYGWGVSPPPQSNYWTELLASVRASETLGLLDYFAVPDIFVYAIKWKTCQWAWEKNGVQRSPTMEQFAKGKFDFYCLLADRFLRHAMDKLGGF
jgi:hypothetical protein